MPPRRDFRAKRTLKVVSFKGGKAVKKTKLNIPARYTLSSASAFPSTSDSTTQIKIDNHKNLRYRFLSIFDINQVISIENYRLQSILSSIEIIDL